MPSLINEESGIFKELLSGDRMEAFERVQGTNAGGQIPPDTHNRTILIGLGGTGVRTINYVKSTIEKKLNPNWRNYVAFLAIDSDSRELAAASNLTADEYVSTTRENITQRLSNPAQYARAWRTFAEEGQVSEIENPNSEGSGQKRLLGKLKIHDEVRNVGAAVDMEIVNKLNAARASLSPLTNNANYEVYVIAGLGGGTGSGSFLEMPALIRKALGNGANVNIYAMIYLPDTLSAHHADDPTWQKQLKANGYAALKELNYFQGMVMRPGYSEKWPYNDSGSPEIRLDASTGFFKIPYLIGTSGGPAMNSVDIACDTVAEFFISILGNMITTGQQTFMIDSFTSNALQNVGVKYPADDNPDKENEGEYHEFPQYYGAIGFASAAAPRKIVTAYAVSTACERAGLQPIDAAERARRKANGDTFLPFLGEREAYTADDGTQKARELLKPVSDFLERYQKAEFNFLQATQRENVTFDDIRRNRYESDVAFHVNGFVEKKTGQNMKDALDQELAAVFAKLRENVKNFVMKEGPMAFVNIYNGSFISQNNFDGVGLRKMLANIVEDRDPVSGREVSRKTADQAKQDVAHWKQEISNANALNPFLPRQSMANSWLTAVESWANLSVNEKRREYALGRHKAIDRSIAQPASVLADQVKAFGYILSSMAESYKTHGEKLQNYTDFQTVADNETEVNIAALHMSAYRWLQNEAQRIAERITGQKTREALVEDFFEDPEAWLTYDESLVISDNNQKQLRFKENPVPARGKFDSCIAKAIDMDMNVSIESLFMDIQTNVSNQQFADSIMMALSMKSQLLFNGNTGTSRHRYVVYPANLSNDIVAAIEQAARQYIGQEVGFYRSAYADSIMVYQFAAPFNMYGLRELGEWENQYISMKAQSNNLMHGRSPDIRREVAVNGTVSYHDNSSWFDYPSICPEPDPTAQRDGGTPHEGLVRIEINKLLEEAKKLGLLYAEKGSAGWSYSVVHFDKYANWNFDLERLDPVDRWGYLPTGKALVEAVAKLNNKELSQLTKTVRLHNGGLMSTPRSSEKWAWTYAKRVLYAHRPMLVELRETVERFRSRSAEVVEYNDTVITPRLDKWIPAKLIRTMQSHMIFKDDHDIWRLDDRNTTIIANLSAPMLGRLRNRNPKEYKLIDKGFELFALHRLLKAREEQEYRVMINNLLAEAQQIISDYNDPELLDATFESVDKKLAEECARIEELGGNLADPEITQTARFEREMDALGIPEDLLPELCMFYHMARKWDEV